MIDCFHQQAAVGVAVTPRCAELPQITPASEMEDIYVLEHTEQQVLTEKPQQTSTQGK